MQSPVPHELPIYRRIADRLRQAIQAGEFHDGDRLPGENALMAEYGIARATARQALSVLINEGVAVPRRGSGVYVRQFRPIRRHGSRRLSRERWGTGRAIWDGDTAGRPYTVDELEIAREPAVDEAARVLGCAEVWVRRRRYSVDGRPVQLAASCFPAELVEGSPVTRPDTGPGGVYARLRDLGHAPAHFTEEVRARMPAPEERDRLGLSAGTPVIVVCRTAFAAGGEAVELNTMIMDAASYVLQYDFDA
ncbi:GntR family transcriptional regulator [Sphaerisporangium melleum]|uniref:GntR family transcriptional regulator n=1 Tax=Sphaerisporangium melleum TaxID=321316 RepID=A0A917R0F7_9ACTN|nr:GntR family transcriptional regulator [Sphaerisporangium melleum]GGK80309.1 GntR family transcriptional regulator [Sphaerisporangium melleum]GII72061.1 GntR family transcriptional regulator [Sphaerisporangium melleum]